MTKLTAILILLVFFLINFASYFPVLAKTEEEYNQEIAQLEAKISGLSNSAKTLGNEITYYDSQISLAALKISQTEDMIANISKKIDSLEKKLSARELVLTRQIVTSYRQSRLDPFRLIMSSTQFSTLLSRLKYNRLVQSNSRKFLYDTQLIQTNYAQQKIIIQDSQKKLAKQKINLSALREQKNLLLIQTKNDEVVYQKLLTQAKSERDSLKAFASSRGGRLLPPQSSPDGWYYNQRDERWGTQCIGSTCSSSSPSFVWEVGCLVTSVAMLWKKNGTDVTPVDIARNTGYFFEDMMLLPWPAQPGRKFTRYGRNLSLVDSELTAGRPVIVEIYTGNQYGGKHFLVLKSKSGSGYLMNDPWEGPDLQYTQFYSLNNIISVSTYTQ